MSPTSIVAWWGAILSTIVFLWDIYEHRTAPPGRDFDSRLKLEWKASTLRRMREKHSSLRNVTNYGDRPTTIANLGYLYFKGKRLLSSIDSAAIASDVSA